jgi:hypothetical protein
MQSVHPSYSSRAFQRYQECGVKQAWFGRSQPDKNEQNKLPCFIDRLFAHGSTFIVYKELSVGLVFQIYQIKEPSVLNLGWGEIKILITVSPFRLFFKNLEELVI